MTRRSPGHACCCHRRPCIVVAASGAACRMHSLRCARMAAVRPAGTPVARQHDAHRARAVAVAAPVFWPSHPIIVSPSPSLPPPTSSFLSLAVARHTSQLLLPRKGARCTCDPEALTTTTRARAGTLSLTSHISHPHTSHHTSHLPHSSLALSLSLSPPTTTSPQERAIESLFLSLARGIIEAAASSSRSSIDEFLRWPIPHRRPLQPHPCRRPCLVNCLATLEISSRCRCHCSLHQPRTRRAPSRKVCLLAPRRSSLQ